LAHFKPFSLNNRLINGCDWKAEYESYKFQMAHTQIMKNWNAIHECEDERDADRLRKRDKATAESKTMTAAVLKSDIGEDNNFNDMVVGEKEDFTVPHRVLLECTWTPRGVVESMWSPGGVHADFPLNLGQFYVVCAESMRSPCRLHVDSI
jgi:hypothetical protein